MKFRDKMGRLMKGHKHSETVKNKIRNSLIGIKHTIQRRRNESLSKKGIKFSKEHCKNISEALKGRDITWKDKIGNSNRGKKKCKIGRINMSNAQKVKWSDSVFAREQRQKMISGISARPTRPELIISQICKLNNLPFRYVGDFKLRVDKYFPDFINDEMRIILEVNGYYWHGLKKAKIRDKNKRRIYSKLGYNYIFFDELEIYRNPQMITQKIFNLLS